MLLFFFILMVLCFTSLYGMLSGSLYCPQEEVSVAALLFYSFSQGWEKHFKNRTTILDNYAEELQNVSEAPGH